MNMALRGDTEKEQSISPTSFRRVTEKMMTAKLLMLPRDELIVLYRE